MINKAEVRHRMENFVTFLRIIFSIALLFCPAFLLLLTVSFIDLKYSGAFVCSLATFSAIQEGHYISKRDKSVHKKLIRIYLACLRTKRTEK